ncbi:hypothetical protein Q3G72_027319 [Acer saccharum]|nr:hypothetical protein Q3G72_027319 [Acer saccharum]
MMKLRQKKYIDISVWVNVGSGVCADDEAKTEDLETEIGVFYDDKAKAEEVENSAGVNAESVVCADDEAKAEEVDIEIGDCAADNEARAKEVDTKIGVFDDNGTSKHQSQWDFKKLRGVIQSTFKVEEVIDQELMIAFNGGRFSLNKSLFEHDRDGCVVFVGGVCADDEAKTKDVETEIGVCADDEAKVEEVENSVGELTTFLNLFSLTDLLAAT